MKISMTAASDAADCSDGCVVATVLAPVRTCTCLRPEACRAQQRQAAAAIQSVARTSGSRGPLLAALAAAAAADCNFCQREAYTYSSFAECYDAGRQSQPASVGVATASYPSLAPPPGLKQPAAATAAALDDVNATLAPPDLAAAVQAAACPPPTSAGCLADSSAVPWTTAFPNVGPSSDVVVAAGSSVLLQGCTLPGAALSVNSITVQPGATLIIGDSPLSLSFKTLIVNGTFRMGSPSCPITSRITVTVPGGAEEYGIDVGGAGASFDVHGAWQGPTWTRVAATVPASTPAVPSRTINLVDAVSWAPGDTLVLVTTTWKDMVVNQNEVLTIESVANGGRTVRVTSNIQFSHYGGEYKAEVALLSRRITFTSDTTSTSTLTGPHTTFMVGNARVSGAAFERWGTRNSPGRYPLHYHMAGEATAGYLRNNAIYNSNWRCVSVHGTNAVTLSGNVGFNIPGHCYYLEDGVEERNVLEGNLAAYVVPINTAGSGGGQQGTDRWAGGALFDPSDAGAAGFYSLNAYNSWIGNAAAGGFAGFSFPNAPRPVKDHAKVKKADGTPFIPGERPLLAFRGNTAHSTGYQWEHGACVYVGGVLAYRRDDSDGVTKLWYNNGRGPYQIQPLCPDPDWPAGKEGANDYCWVSSSRNTRSADGTAEGFLLLEGTSAALCNVGIKTWGARAEVRGLAAYDVSISANFQGQSWLTNALVKVNTTNSATGASGWPWTSRATWFESWPIKGFEWYDTATSTLLSNVTFDGYRRGSPYTDDPTNWWFQQAPSAFRMLSASDQFKPDRLMVATKGLASISSNLGGCAGGSGPPSAACPPGALFRLDATQRGASWFFTWLDQDGSLVRQVAPSRPQGPYLIGSAVPWWRLGPSSWQEPAFNGAWVSPLAALPAAGGEAHARLDMRVAAAGGARYTMSAAEGEVLGAMGWVSQWGDVTRSVPLSRTEGTLGMTGPTGWYVVFNNTAGPSSGPAAPKRLELIVSHVARGKAVLWASCWPLGTTLSVSRTQQWDSCLNQPTLPAAPSRAALIGGNGGTMWVDPATNCLHLKVMDWGPVSQPWSKSFARDGLALEETVRWYDYKYIITATGSGMSCADTHFCPLTGNPGARVPPAVTALPASCSDVAPPGGVVCPAVACGTALLGCSAAAVLSQGLCQASCGSCPALPPPPPPPSPPPPPPPPVRPMVVNDTAVVRVSSRVLVSVLANDSPGLGGGTLTLMAAGSAIGGTVRVVLSGRTRVVQFTAGARVMVGGFSYTVSNSLGQTGTGQATVRVVASTG